MLEFPYASQHSPCGLRPAAHLSTFAASRQLAVGDEGASDRRIIKLAHGATASPDQQTGKILGEVPAAVVATLRDESDGLACPVHFGW